MPNPYANLTKLIQAVSLLAAPGGTTVKTLMAKLGLSKRSVFRLLEALGDLGFPIVDERRDLSAEKVYRLLDNYAKKLPNLSLPSFDLNDQERFYLDAILEGHSLQDHSTGALLSSLRAKLHALLPELDADPIPSDPLGPSSTEDLLATIRTAIKTSQALSVIYRSPVDAIARSYVIYPVKLIEHRGGLYLLAKPEAQAAVRLLDIDLFEHATLAAHTPEHPVDIDYAAAMASLFDLESDDPVDATIRFAPAAATKIQSRHVGQLHSTKLNPDGSFTVHIGSRNLRELLRWVLSYGPDAEILAPPELRSMTRKELAQTLAQYDSNRPSRP
jgi:proteasome accessory factor B